MGQKICDVHPFLLIAQLGASPCILKLMKCRQCMDVLDVHLSTHHPQRKTPGRHAPTHTGRHAATPWSCCAVQVIKVLQHAVGSGSNVQPPLALPPPLIAHFELMLSLGNGGAPMGQKEFVRQLKLCHEAWKRVSRALWECETHRGHTHKPFTHACGHAHCTHSWGLKQVSSSWAAAGRQLCGRCSDTSSPDCIAGCPQSASMHRLQVAGGGRLHIDADLAGAEHALCVLAGKLVDPKGSEVSLA
eukprot:364209-Chlamydomonas_euryale.AAC.3